MEEKIRFIVNPVAGSGRALNVAREIENYLKDKEINYQIIYTEETGHGKYLAQEAVREDFTTVVAVGGDGTVNEVINGLAYEDIKFAIIPAGTGNDSVKSLKTPLRLQENIDKILEGKTEKIDLGIINGSYFINIASVGFDAYVVIATDRIKKHVPRKTAYIFGLLSALFTYKQKRVRIISDKLEYEGEILLLAAGNGKYYGSGFKILPEAEMNDGLLNMCFSKKVNLFGLVRLLTELIRGKHLENKSVSYIEGKKIIIEPKEEIEFNLDGEIELSKEKIEIEIAEKAINIII